MGIELNVFFLMNIPNKNPLYDSTSEECNCIHLLVAPSPLLPVYRAKPSYDDSHDDISGVGPPGHRRCRRGQAPPLAGVLARAGDDAHDLSVAHLEIRGPVRGGLRADLAVQAAQLVPAAPVDAQQREVVGRGV